MKKILGYVAIGAICLIIVTICVKIIASSVRGPQPQSSSGWSPGIGTSGSMFPGGGGLPFMPPLPFLPGIPGLPKFKF